MTDSPNIELLKELIMLTNDIQSRDDRFEMLSRRLNAILRLIQSTKKHVSVSADFNSLLRTIRDALDKCLKEEPSEAMLSELKDINSRLVKHLVSLTNDSKKKIELFSAILYDDQVASKRRYDIELRERESLRKLVLHAQLTDLNLASKKALQILNTQFKTAIKPYVEKCISVHGTIQVRGLEQISQDFGRKFYGQISKNNAKIKTSLVATVNIPLQSIHVHLRADKSTAFERQEARNTMTLGSVHVKGYDEALWTKLAIAPYMPSLMERDRFVSDQNQKQSLSSANILQNHRWIVVLGDPGSGKTTLVRWLALKFAQAFKNEENIVKLTTITENGTKSEMITVGPTRIPILIRVGEYGDALQKDSALSLFDYIGRHQWIGQTFVNIASTTERNRAITQLSNALKSYVQAGQALIILDGLDEIPVSEQRYRIVDRIETFVEQFVQTPSCMSAFDQEKFGFSWAHLSQIDLPISSGGNQIIVTSRIVGYHAGPLKGNFAHFTLEPLRLSGIYSFIDHWFEAVHQQLLHILRINPQNNKIIKSKVNEQTSRLKTEIDNLNNKGLRELASNPLLLSVICIMSFQLHGLSNRALPVHRVCLYHDAVEWMLNSWRNRDSSIHMDDVKSVLCKLATYIHENSASGLIEQSTMTRLCSESLTATTSENRVSDFVRIIREEVGVLAARGEFAYGFLHLTFQEYFVALDMLDIELNLSTEKAESIASQFFKHMSDPRYREPLLLSLGLISWKYSAGEYDSFCCELLSKRNDQSEIFSSLMPLGAMLFVTSIGDLVKLPSDTLVFDAFDQILNASVEHQWHQFFPDLKVMITNGLTKLPLTIAKKWVTRFLNSTSISASQICALCHALTTLLAQNTSTNLNSVLWLDRQIVGLLWTHLSFEYDDEDLIIDSTLTQLVQVYPSWFDSPRLRFRTFAISNNLLIPPYLLSLIIVLYGGLWRDTNHQVLFTTKYIHRDSCLTPLLIRYFHSNNASSREINFSRLLDYCNRVIESLTTNDHSLRAVDSFLALFCLKNIKQCEHYQYYTKYKAFQLAQKRMKRVSSTLCQFYFSPSTCKSSASTDGTDIVANLAQMNDFENNNSSIKSLAMTDFIENAWVIANAVRRLTSGRDSFLFPGQTSETSLIELPTLFFNTKLIQNILVAKNSITGLPNFLRKFWSLRLDPGSHDDRGLRRCINIDCLNCVMAVGHDATPLFALTFLPELVQRLYIQLFHRSECLLENDHTYDSKECLCEIHLLAECLLELHDHSCCKYTMTYLLVLLHTLLKKAGLENFAASFIWTLKSPVLKKHYYSMIDLTFDDDICICRTIKEEQADNVYGESELENEGTIILNAVAFEMSRLQKNLSQTSSDDLSLYSSCVSLSHMCWFVAETKWELLTAVSQAVRCISNPIYRLHALSIIISHPCVTPVMCKPLFENRTLQDAFKDSLKILPLISSPMVASLLIVRCLPHVDTNEMRSQLIGLILEKFHDLKQSSPDDAQVVGEILSLYSSKSLDPLLVQEQQQQTSIREMKSPILFDHLNSSVTTSYTANQQTTLAACHLTELAYDCQKFISEQSAESLSKYVFDNVRILPASIAVDITRQIQSSNPDLEKIGNLLHLFDQVSSAGSQIVQQWLFYEEDELKIFTYHAALLLAHSNIWSVLGMNILCDLLLNKTDRYRQRAEIIMRNKSLPWRSSQLGSDVFQALIEKYSLFVTVSPYASLMVLWSFEKLEIDDIDHLIELMTREKRHIDDQFENITDDNERIQNATYYINLVHGVSTPVFCHFVQTIESAINSITKMDMKSSSVELQILFVEHLLYGQDTYATVPQNKILVDMCARILNDDMVNIRIRQAVVFALAYGGKDSLTVLQAEILKSVPPSFLSVAIDSYCRCLSVHYGYMTELETAATKSFLEHVIRFLFDSPNEVSQAAADGLARIYALWDTGLDDLLKCLHDDHIRAYCSLLNATRDTFVSTDNEARNQTAAEFIERHSTSLLPLFILELFQSIEHFDVSVHKRANIVGYRGVRAIVDVAAILVQKMPSAFCAEVNRSEFGEKLKRALFYTSKQHNFPRRAACVAILSSFGDLTFDMCDMFVTALLDSPWLQTTSYECVSRIQLVSDPSVIPKLFSYMSSESLIARYTIAKLLVRLHQHDVIPVEQVQRVLSQSIKDQSSHQNLWLCAAAADASMTMDGVYEYAGRLDRLIYSMLIEMSFNISKLTPNNSALSNNNYQTLLERDFQHSNTVVCCSPFKSIGSMKKISIVGDFGLDQRISVDLDPSNIHRHMLPLLYQILWWKEERGMTFPPDIRASLIKLYGLAEENNMDAKELMYYAMTNTDNQNETNEEEEA